MGVLGARVDEAAGAARRLSFPGLHFFGRRKSIVLWWTIFRIATLDKYGKLDLRELGTRWYTPPTGVLSTGGDDNDCVGSCLPFSSPYHPLGT